MPSNSPDLQFLTEALPQLQDYLLSDELYWPLSGTLPRLTLGSVRLALARSEVFEPAQTHALQLEAETVRAKWRAVWEKKAARETASRLRLWLQFLSDYVNAPGKYADAYPREARGRVILAMLLSESPESSEKATLANTDALLKSHLLPGGFIWEADLQVAFPKPEFWFLYGKLKP